MADDAPLPYWLNKLDSVMADAKSQASLSLLDTVASLGHEMGVQQSDALLAANPRLFEYSPILEEAFYNYAVSAEDHEIERLRALKLTKPIAYCDAMGEEVRDTYNRVSDIFEWLDFSSCERFVMIGCGQLPLSALHVHDRTNVGEVVCVDVRQEAVDDVRFLARKLGINNLRSDLCDGKDFDFQGARIVYVANMVKGKDAVVARVLETAPEEVQIVVRSPAGLGRLWTEALEDVTRLGMRITKRGHVGRYLAHDQLLTTLPQGSS